MPRTYDNYKSLCPFFMTSGKKHIMCEGIIDKCSIDILFKDEMSRNLYKSIYCDAKYKNCKIYRMLCEKYYD